MARMAFNGVEFFSVYCFFSFEWWHQFMACTTPYVVYRTGRSSAQAQGANYIGQLLGTCAWLVGFTVSCRSISRVEDITSGDKGVWSQSVAQSFST